MDDWDDMDEDDVEGFSLTRSDLPAEQSPATKLLDAFLRGFGASHRPDDLDPCTSDLAFVQRYRPLLDGHPFDFHRYKHLVEWYADDHPEQVGMCAAQSGKTGRALTFAIRRLLLEWGSLGGYYLPDYKLAGPFSEDRFTPYVRSVSELARHLGAAQRDKKGRDAVLTKSLGASTLYFMSTGGKSSTEGLPLRLVVLDEVRRMLMGDIERVMERYSAQERYYDLKVSTAGLPESTIDYYFRRSDQRHFHTSCASDPNGLVLSLEYPNCIADLRKASPQLLRSVEHAFTIAGLPFCNMTADDRQKYPLACYIHPRTGEIITDPREGWWEPHGTGWAHGYQMPQLLGYNFPAGRVLARYENARDQQEFYNSVLGLPHLDRARQPVHEEHLLACVEDGLYWPANMSHEWRRANLKNTAMGVDAQAGYLVATIKERAPNGKFRTIHAEIVHGGEAGNVDEADGGWRRLGWLMQEYDVARCVIDWLPHWNEALRFARVFRGRVWLATYADTTDAGAGGDIALWKETTKKKGRRGEESQFRYTVRIQRTRGLQWSLGRWVKRINEIPHPGRLTQTLPRMSGRARLSSGLRVGDWEAVPIIRDLYFPHQMGIVFMDEYEGDDEAERRGKHKVVAQHLGEDPHFAHANLFADLALDAIRPSLALVNT